MASFQSEQAAVIRSAHAASRKLSAWSATVAVSGGDRRIAIVFAVTERAAKTLAGLLGGVVRVGPAHVRDLDAAITRALGSAVSHASRVSLSAPEPLPSERERAREYLRGVAARPSDAAVYSALGTAVRRRVAGEPRRAPKIHVGSLQGTPIVGEYTLTGGRRAA
jgi:hypothetical protein